MAKIFVIYPQPYETHKIFQYHKPYNFGFIPYSTHVNTIAFNSMITIILMGTKKQIVSRDENYKTITISKELPT